MTRKTKKDSKEKSGVAGKSVGHGSVADTAPAIHPDKDTDPAWIMIRFWIQFVFGTF